MDDIDNTLWNLTTSKKSSYILRRPQNFAKSPPYFWLALHFVAFSEYMTFTSNFQNFKIHCQLIFMRAILPLFKVLMKKTYLEKENMRLKVILCQNNTHIQIRNAKEKRKAITIKMRYVRYKGQKLWNQQSSAISNLMSSWKDIISN